MRVPGRDIDWRELVATLARRFAADDIIHLAGSVAGVLVWNLVSWRFSLYVNRTPRYEVIYGTLGSLLVLLGGAALNAILDVPPCPREERRLSPTATEPEDRLHRHQTATVLPPPARRRCHLLGLLLAFAPSLDASRRRVH